MGSMSEMTVSPLLCGETLFPAGLRLDPNPPLTQGSDDDNSFLRPLCLHCTASPVPQSLYGIHCTAPSLFRPTRPSPSPSPWTHSPATRLAQVTGGYLSSGRTPCHHHRGILHDLISPLLSTGFHHIGDLTMRLRTAGSTQQYRTFSTVSAGKATAPATPVTHSTQTKV